MLIKCPECNREISSAAACCPGCGYPINTPPKGKYYQMDDYILKMIVGHAINDVTEKTYTHRVIEELRREIEKIIE